MSYYHRGGEAGDARKKRRESGMSSTGRQNFDLETWNGPDRSGPCCGLPGPARRIAGYAPIIEPGPGLRLGVADLLDASVEPVADAVDHVAVVSRVGFHVFGEVIELFRVQCDQGRVR